MKWDFRVSRVHSISASGHKFGLVYPGVGWILCAKREYLPEELIFNVSYLTDMPLVSWTTDNHNRPWDLHDLSAKLRERGWQVPAYPMPADIQDLTVMRVVFRNGVSIDLTRLLVADITASIQFLDARSEPTLPAVTPTAPFHH